MSTFVKTGSILDQILQTKVEEVARAKQTTPLHEMRTLAEHASTANDFVASLHRDTVALIAEVKKASPSKGVLIENFDPLKLAQVYAYNGAAAISVLTDTKYFQGHIDYLEQINRHVSVPTLRKDFIIDEYQVYEARKAGASAVLLIVAALDDQQLAALHTLITALGMSALVEVHNERELDRAMRIDPALIGVNNRDLKTFEVDLKTTERIAQRVPETVTLVAESGLKSGIDIANMGKMGAHAVLIGEGLVTAESIADAVRDFSGQQRETR